MAWNEYQVRQWLQREHQLLRELLLMLVTALVVGIYFLEHVHSTLEQSRRQSAQALAQHLASSSVEYIVTGNLVSLNVIASRAAALDTVRRIEFRSVEGTVLASAGESIEDVLPAASRAARLENQSMAGTVELWSRNASADQEENLETWFVLVALCLLALRIVAEFIWRRMQMERAPLDDVEADMVPVLEMSQTSESPKAILRISIVNFDRMKARLTPMLIDEMVAPYQNVLASIAEVYGARLVALLGQQCALEFHAESKAEAAFQGLCAGMLFRHVAKNISTARKGKGRSPLEFKLLVSSNNDLSASWEVCVAGLPGRVHVPEAELVRLELDARVLYQADRCLNVSNGEASFRLQPVEQLAQRYQKLIAGQADSILAVV